MTKVNHVVATIAPHSRQLWILWHCSKVFWKTCVNLNVLFVCINARQNMTLKNYPIQCTMYESLTVLGTCRSIVWTVGVGGDWTGSRQLSPSVHVHHWLSSDSCTVHTISGCVLYYLNFPLSILPELLRNFIRLNAYPNHYIQNTFM